MQLQVGLLTTMVDMMLVTWNLRLPALDHDTKLHSVASLTAPT